VIPGLGLLARVPLRWWLYIAGALAICFILWKEDRSTQRANKATARAIAAEARADQLAGTIETMKVDAALKQETTNALAERLEDVERDSLNHPLRLRCYSPFAAAVPAKGGSAGGADEAAGGRVDAGADLPTFDAGPGLQEFQRRCARNAAHQLTLQEFEAKRTH
jgi:hypothetical protein